MGMRIGHSSPAVNTTGSSAWQQKQQDVKGLMSALQSGDLATAQKAYATLTNDNGTPTGDGPLAKIGQALQSGDLSAAQQAAQSWGAGRSGRHHHHSDAPPATASTSPAPAAGGTVGTLLNISA